MYKHGEQISGTPIENQNQKQLPSARIVVENKFKEVSGRIWKGMESARAVQAPAAEVDVEAC